MNRRHYLKYLLAPGASLAGCSTAVRLEVSEGQIFQLTDSAEPLSSDFVVVDRRANPRVKTTREALEIMVGEADLEPNPVAALRREIAFLQGQTSQWMRSVKRVGGKTVALDEFEFFVKAVDVSKPPPGVAGAQPPGVELVAIGMRSLGGNSLVYVNISLTIDGTQRLGSSKVLTTANPGHLTTMFAFRRAVASALMQLPD